MCASSLSRGRHAVASPRTATQYPSSAPPVPAPQRPYSPHTRHINLNPNPNPNPDQAKVASRSAAAACTRASGRAMSRHRRGRSTGSVRHAHPAPILHPTHHPTYATYSTRTHPTHLAYCSLPKVPNPSYSAAHCFPSPVPPSHAQASRTMAPRRCPSARPPRRRLTNRHP